MAYQRTILERALLPPLVVLPDRRATKPVPGVGACAGAPEAEPSEGAAATAAAEVECGDSMPRAPSSLPSLVARGGGALPENRDGKPSQRAAEADAEVGAEGGGVGVMMWPLASDAMEAFDTLRDTPAGGAAS